MKKVKLPEMQTKEFKVLAPFSVKDDGGENPEVLIIEGIANYQGKMDADGNGCFVDLMRETVVTSGIKIDVYKKNPQILWQHNRNYTIGKALTVTKKEDGLYIKAEIHREAMEEKDFYRLKAKLVGFFSIGFRCLKVTEKEIKGKPVWFIDESQLFECSCVSLPCNTESGFAVIKAYEDGTFGAGEIVNFSDTTDNDTQIHKSEDGDTMKIKLADKYSADEISKMVKLGLVSDADAEIEVNTKDYVDLLVMEKFETFKAEFKAELKAEQDAIVKAAEDKLALEVKEAEDKAKAALAEKLTVTVEDLEKMTDEEIETKVKALESLNEEEEFTADELLALKELAADSNAYLKSLLEE